MKILLAVDGSAYTQKMLAYLTSHQEMLGTGHEYTIITVQPLLPPRARAALGKEVVEQYYDEESAKILQPVLEFLKGRGVEAQSISKVGPIADTIIHAAQDGKFDLIAMGTHGHGALGRLVMGSVSSQVLAGCTIPVLLIR
ncbi:universal stress protein UspA [Comamonas testosteroni]|jgi:nucleotide-binding universal stress UspA family protein|uniref:Universal stress protein n=1 Tax=Comamonas testosteroni TaxID=285 RepID=A0A096F8D1_COMTE|nr:MULTISPECIES: universal stress protein [Comamonas]KGH25973.1 universal stress protein UspA [Comamonas testosteroni]KOC19457.1 universal stress protein UspA [Comamonas testosteroni]KWT73833.1 UspA [Comamonas testosteroni]MDN5502661.1 universal stress protein [Comamonas sp.]MDN5535517.1 universal stress protein [Comamonas sp.]